MWVWLAVRAALAQSDGAYPVCDPTQADMPCDLDPSWSPLEAEPDEGRAIGTETDVTPDVLPEPWRPLTSYAFLEPGVVPGVRPAAPEVVEWEETVLFRPRAMPEAVGDQEIPNPLRPLDWPGTPTVRVTVPIPGPETNDAQDERLEIERGPWIERGSEVGSE